MSVRFNHTIVHCRSKEESARFVAGILGLAEPRPFGPFLMVDLEDEADFDPIGSGAKGGT